MEPLRAVTEPAQSLGQLHNLIGGSQIHKATKIGGTLHNSIRGSQ
jgi:hypothetical protein